MSTFINWEPPPAKPVLVPGEVHVWGAGLDELPTEVLGSGLSKDEQARVERFHFARDRRRFIVARGLLRRLLARYLDRQPSAFRFALGRGGKPSLAREAGLGDLRFNVSHSGGLGLIAFSWDRELGVDLERERPLPEAESIAVRYFSPREAEDLLRLPEPERGRAFFRCWTRKEAFVKATGDGLSRPLDAFDVTLGPGEPARLLRVVDEPAEAGRWWLEDLKPAMGFAAALAVEGRPKRIGCWKVVGWKEDEAAEETYGAR